MAIDLNTLPSNSVNNINTNFERVEEALDDAISRSGTGPNQMNADLDMNGNDLLNVNTLQVSDLTIDGSDPTGILTRALEAAQEAEGSAVVAQEAEQGAVVAQQAAEVAADEAEAAAASILNSVKSFQTIPLFLADTSLSYTAGPGKIVVSAGDVVEAGNQRYIVVTTGTTDNDVITNGNVKFNLLPGPDRRYALSGLGIPAGGNITTKLQNFLNKIRSVGFPESVVIDGWWTISSPIRVAPWVRLYGSGLGMLRAVGPFGSVKFEVAAHDTIPAGTATHAPMIWMAESPVTPAALISDPTLQARIGSSDGTTARRENAYIDVSVTLECNNVANEGLFTDNIQNSKFECLIKDAVDNGVHDYFYGWGNEHLESIIGAGIVGKWLRYAGNGVHVGGKQIFGNPVEPSVAHILVEGDSNGMNIDMGFVEKGVTGILLRRAVGPINIRGIDFEIFSSYAIDIDGSTVQGTRVTGPVNITNCFLETSGSQAVIRVNNAIVNVEGCRIRNTSGGSAATLAVFEVIGSDSVVNDKGNFVQTSIGARNRPGVIVETQSGFNNIKRTVRASTTSINTFKEESVNSDPYNYNLPLTKDIVESIVFNAGTQDVGSRRTITSEIHLAGATTGIAGLVVDGTQGTGTLGVMPPADNTNQLGRAARQWKTIYLVTAAVVSSDRRKKNVEYETLPDSLLDAWIKHVKYGAYTWKEDDDKGLRAGLYAQDIIAAFEEAGLDWTEWAIIEVDDDGFYHVVKDEAQAIENAMVRRKLGL